MDFIDAIIDEYGLVTRVIKAKSRTETETIEPFCHIRDDSFTSFPNNLSSLVVETVATLRCRPACHLALSPELSE